MSNLPGNMTAERLDAETEAAVNMAGLDPNDDAVWFAERENQIQRAREMRAEK